MKKYSIAIFSLIAGLSIGHFNYASDEIYRYKNADGNIVYSDRKPNTEYDLIKGIAPKSPSPPEITEEEPAPPARASEDVSKVLNSLKTDIDVLYTELVNNNSETQGKVIVSFTINQGGDISFCAEDESELQGDKFNGAICEKIKGLDFGEVESPDPVRLNFTYNFGSAS